MENEILPGSPEKKWYEREVKRDIFFPILLDEVRERLVRRLESGIIKKKGFFNRSTRLRGKIIGNYIDMRLDIPAGRSSLDYHVYGTLVGYSNGCQIQYAIRDSNPMFGLLTFVIFVALICVSSGITAGIFAAIFFGAFMGGALVLQHTTGMAAVSNAIHESVSGSI